MAILSVVRNKRNKIESVTVYVQWRAVESATKKIESVYGGLDITYSYGATYKQLDRPRSGLYTGKPLKGETLKKMPARKACAEAERIYKKDFPVRKKWLWWFPARDAKGRFLARKVK